MNISDIQKGQIWERIPVKSEHFPVNSWKIEVLSVTALTVNHKVVEYDGQPRNGSVATMSPTTLLENYTLLA